MTGGTKTTAGRNLRPAVALDPAAITNHVILIGIVCALASAFFGSTIVSTPFLNVAAIIFPELPGAR